MPRSPKCGRGAREPARGQAAGWEVLPSSSPHCARSPAGGARAPSVLRARADHAVALSHVLLLLRQERAGGRAALPRLAGTASSPPRSAPPSRQTGAPQPPVPGVGGPAPPPSSASLSPPAPPPSTPPPPPQRSPGLCAPAPEPVASPSRCRGLGPRTLRVFVDGCGGCSRVVLPGNLFSCPGLEWVGAGAVFGSSGR